MPEFITIFLLIFLIPSVFWIFHLPTEYMKETVFVIIFLLSLPLLYTLFTAPFVPSKRERIQKMIQLACLHKNFTVYELGCGDARIIRLAAKQGIKKAVGFDLSIPLVLYGKFMSFIQGNSAKIEWGNIWNQDYSNVDVIFCYLLPIAMKRVEKEIWPQLKPGAKIVSNAFPLINIKEEKKEDGIYVYIKS